MEDNNESLPKRTITRRNLLRVAAGGAAGLIASKAKALSPNETQEKQNLSPTMTRPELPYKTTIVNIAQDTQEEEIGSDEVLAQSDKIMLKSARVFPGIIDLFHKNESGQWEQWNNIVPIAKVGDEWANAELDKVAITKKIIAQEKGLLKVKYDFAPLSNGAHFSLIAELENGKNEAKFSVEVAPDSAPISHFAMGNYYGLKDEVRYVESDGQTYDALMYEPPKDGNYKLGNFMKIPLPADGRVKFWGENGRIQYQKFEHLDEGDELTVELRRNPWLSQQKDPGHNWFETVHLTRDISENNNLSVTFGVEE